ncbi:MAG: hypothetical protein J5685_04285 [Clostridiales bacterium]|nr:hypothetical protein [Clostridiales bacterium]
MKIRIGLDNYLAVSLIYLILPVIVLGFGMMRIPWAVILGAALLVTSSYLVFPGRKKKEKGLPDSESIEISPVLFFVSVPVIIIWVYFSGIGEFSWTTADHPYRAAVLNDMVAYKWPVVFDLSKQTGALKGMTGTRVLAYYYAFWTIPALIGKMFGIFAARVALLIWSVLGAFLILTGLFFIQKKPSFTALAMLVLFSTFDFIPITVMDILNLYDGSWEGWNTHLNLHSNTFQMMNVFNQCIPGWLATVLLLKKRDCRWVGLTGSIVFCYSPWGAVGMVPFALYVWLYSRDGKINRIKDMLSLWNFLPALSVIAFMAPFYLMNTLTMKGWAVSFYSSPGAFIISVVLYFIFETGIWFLLLWPRRRDPGNILYDRKLFVSLLPVFIILPFYLVGGITNDLLMRGSLVPLFVLFVMSVLRLDETVAPLGKGGKHIGIKDAGILLTYFIAALTPIMLIVASIAGSAVMYRENGFNNPDTYSLGSYGDVRDEEFEQNVLSVYLADGYEDSIFARYIAR